MPRPALTEFVTHRQPCCGYMELEKQSKLAQPESSAVTAVVLPVSESACLMQG